MSQLNRGFRSFFTFLKFSTLFLPCLSYQYRYDDAHNEKCNHACFQDCKYVHNAADHEQCLDDHKTCECLKLRLMAAIIFICFCIGVITVFCLIIWCCKKLMGSEKRAVGVELGPGMKLETGQLQISIPQHYSDRRSQYQLPSHDYSARNNVY